MDEPECAAYMRKQYSHDGIDIIGYDGSSVTCLMPCDFEDLTDFLHDIQQRFGYEADFTFAKKTGQATLIFAKQKDQGTTKSRFLWTSHCWQSFWRHSSRLQQSRHTIGKTTKMLSLNAQNT